jgi:hypothetical protein
MAPKKQRPRRSKLQRHEYEYIVETDEGEEVVEAPRPARAKSGAGASKMPEGAVVDRRGRVIPPPSWQRVFKRAAIFGPIMFILLFLLGGSNVSTQAKILNAIFLVLVFIPFSYLTDRLIYRSVQKRQQRDSGR